MKICGFFMVLIWLNIELAVSCIPVKEKSETIQAFHYSGLDIAVDNLIREYEKEHQKFQEEENKNGEYLEWPDLDNKNLTNYCQKYIQHSVPTRPNENAVGTKMIKPLHYTGKNYSTTNAVVMVHCKVKFDRRVVSYYVTRAPLTNCVYALICRGKFSDSIYSIINKHCDFEDKPLILRRPLKRERTEIINKIHSTTGEPIAKEEYLFQYELEHKDMIKKNEKEGKCIEWPYAMEHYNLDSYCYNYIRRCAPTRNREGVKGSWKFEKLRYLKLSTNEDIAVTTILCRLTKNKMRRHYHFTRAPETNCVYALLRQNNSKHLPFVIIFKHCDFEHSNDKKTSAQLYDNTEENIYPKSEVKEEIFDTLETLHFFPKD